MAVDRTTQAYKDAVAAEKRFMAATMVRKMQMPEIDMSQYQARPGNTSRGAIAPVGDDEPDAIANILASLPDRKYDRPGSSNNTPGKKEQDKSVLKSILNGAKDGGTRLLDILSRGNYASANAVDAAIDSDNAGGDYRDNINAAIRGAGRGVTGKDKTTYSKVIKEHVEGVDPDGDGKDWRVGAAGFVGDVLLDPTTYIGVGLIGKAGKLGVNGAAKAIDVVSGGKTNVAARTSTARRAAEEAEVVRSADEASNFTPTPTKPVTNPEPSGDHSFDLSGLPTSGPSNFAPRANPTLADLKFNPVVERPRVVAQVAEQAAQAPERARVAPPQVPNAMRNKRIAAAISDINKTKAEIEKARPNRYADNLDIPAPFVNRQVKDEVKGLNDADANRMAIKIAILNDDNFPIASSRVKGQPSLSTKRFKDLVKAKPETKAQAEMMLEKAVTRVMNNPDELARISREAMDAGDKGFEHAGIALRALDGRQIGSHSTRALADLLTGKGMIKKSDGVDNSRLLSDVDDLDNVYINNSVDGGEMVSLRTLLNEHAPRKKGEVVTQRLAEKELDLWNRKHGANLDPEDLEALLKADNPVEFKKKLTALTKTKKDGRYVPDEAMTARIEELTKQLDTAKSEPELIDQVYKKEGDLNTPVLPKERSFIGKKDGLPVEKPTVKQARTANAVAAVPTAEEVIEKTMVEGPAAFEKAVTALNPAQAQGVINALETFIGRDIIEPLIEGTAYKFTTKSGTRRTAAKRTEGLGNNVEGFNEFSQGATLGKSILSEAVKQLDADAMRKLPIGDPARGKAIREIAEPMLRSAWDVMEAAGIRSISGTKNTGAPLALPDLLKAFPDELAETYFYDAARQILPTTFLRMGQMIIEHADELKAGKNPPPLDKQIDTLLRARVGTSSGKDVYNTIARPDSILAKQDIARTIGNAKKNGKPIPTASDASKALIDNRIAKAVRLITDPAVVAKVAEAGNITAARYAIESGKKITSIEEGVLNSVKQVISNPNASAADAMNAVLDTSKVATATAKEVKATTAEAAKGKALAEDKIEKIIPKDDLATSRAAKAAYLDLHHPLGTMSPAAQRVFAKKSAANTRAESAARIPTEVAEAEKVVVIDDWLELRHTNNLGRIWHGLGSSFSTHMGASTLRPAEWANTNRYMGISHDYNRAVGNLHKTALETFGESYKSRIKEAFNAALRGAPVGDDAAAYTKQIESAMAYLKDLPERAGMDHDLLNYYLPKNGLPQFDFKPLSGKSAVDQIKAWEGIDDPLDFLSRLHKTMTDSANVTALANTFSSMGSRTNPGDWVKIANRKGDNLIYTLIDQDLFYPAELAGQLAVTGRAHKMLETMASKDNTPFVKLFDKVTRAWKTGMTVIRPGHHARNLYSDMALTYLDDVVDPAVYFHGARIIRTHKGSMQGEENFAYINDLAEGILPDNYKAMSGTPVNLKGASINVSDDAMYKLASKQGLFPGYTLLEDTANGATRASGLPVVRQVVKAGGYVSEAEANFTRMSHFVGAFQQELKGIAKKSRLSDDQAMELAAKRAGARVRKYHPDGSDLTGFEKGVMRRASMFYSWNRKAIPLIASSVARRPGKVMVFPKAMYNTAVGMGVDPESLSSPFPDDQLFPDYMTAALTGPQFEIDDKYYKLNPGDPFSDTFASWGVENDDTLAAPRTGLGTLNPILRVPLEMIIQQKVNTGADITDMSDYIDGQIPVVNTLANVTNRSITRPDQAKSGNVLGYVDNKRVEDPNPGMNPTAGLNWLTGIGLQSMSEPQMIKGGEQDLRDTIKQMFAAQGG